MGGCITFNNHFTPKMSFHLHEIMRCKYCRGDTHTHKSWNSGVIFTLLNTDVIGVLHLGWVSHDSVLGSWVDSAI